MKFIKMYLGNFIKNLNRKYHKIYFSGIAFNSMQVRKDNIFFAIEGKKFDGNKYIFEAISKGAKIIISKKNIQLNSLVFVFHFDYLQLLFLYPNHLMIFQFF